MSEQGRGARLSGRTAPVAFAPSADVAVVLAAGGVYGVDLRSAGRPEALSAMDRHARARGPRFRRTPALFLGGEEAAALVVDRAATLASAEMLGAADHVLAMTVQYAKDRVQFGKPIGSFQAVKHMLADARSTWRGCARPPTTPPGRGCRRPGALAVGQHGQGLVLGRLTPGDGGGLQVHGGIGFTWEYDMHLYLKRAQLDQVSYGDAAAHRDHIATLLRQRIESGQSLS